MTEAPNSHSIWPEKTVQITVAMRRAPDELQNVLLTQGLACGLTCSIEIETNDGLSIAKMTARGSAAGCSKLMEMYQVPRISRSF